MASSLLGPFTAVDPACPTPPANLMTLDGTFYVAPSGQPWMVYSHEWLQTIDGTMEAIRLTPDLSRTIGDPVFLFTASDASWITEEIPAGVPNQLAPYITDGTLLPRTPDGSLLMPWSTYEKNVAGKDGTISGGYVQTYATSKSGGIEGPWQQHRPPVREDRGHGMLFHTFDGRLMMILHRPFENARGKLSEMELAGQELRVLRRRADLDGGGRRRAADRQDRSDRRDAPPVVDTFDHRPTCLYDQYRCSARGLTTGRAAPRAGGAGT
ncbi:hypothetical protein [Streptomyces europaeiscabiei]|uniref:hypothetical protein n=1 Tax=Streptomyces europaeiscabiei TaxID=146819 RepID=UPI0039A74C7F